MKIKRSYIYLAAISIIFMCLISITAALFTKSLNNLPSSPSETEVIYVYLPDSEWESENQKSPFFIKERDEKIGIFDSEGKLLKIIETYVKTLPENERTAIREGFEVSSEKELYSIIEAYTD